jgi:hypothetical protein
MKRARWWIIVLPLALLFLSRLLSGADLSTYRGFQFGMTLNSAVQHSGMDPSEVTLLHQRPARIEELAWIPERFSGAGGEMDPVKQVLFSFYNGQLFRLVVDYDADRTKGMSVQDLIEAISAQYGAATRPVAEALLPSRSFSKTVTVVVCWENADYSFSLVQSPYGSGYGLIAFCKRLDGMAQEAIAYGKHLDDQERPQRQKIDKQNVQDKLENVRLANRMHFRP